MDTVYTPRVCNVNEMKTDGINKPRHYVFIVFSNSDAWKNLQQTTCLEQKSVCGTPAKRTYAASVYNKSLLFTRIHFFIPKNKNLLNISKIF